MSTSYGKVIKCYNIWKNIPLRVNNEKLRKCNKFERILINFAEKRIRLSIEPLKN